jgi:intracellular multiplication protein IcmB
MAITSMFSSLMGAWGIGTKKDLASFCYLETADGDNVLVAKDGSLASVIRVDGIKQVMGTDELNNIVNEMSLKMAPYLSEEGRAIQIWFARDPDLSVQMVADNVATQRGVADQLGMDFSDVFRERELNLPEQVVWEGFYIVLWTRLSVLTKREIEAAKVEHKVPKMMPRIEDAQDPFKVGRVLKSTHGAFVSSFLSDLEVIQIRARQIDVHEALKVIKWSVYPDLIGADWKAHLPGDGETLRQRIPEISDYDASHLLWPRLQEQIFDREAVRVNPRVIKVGARFFTGMDMSIGPLQTQSFDHLMRRMMELREFPWRISFLLEGAGLKSTGLKKFLASIFQITNGENNRQIRESITTLMEEQAEGTTIAKMRVSFATWSPVDDTGKGLKLIEDRASKLQQAVQNWGNCGVTMLVGDPVQGVMSSAIGLDVASTAPAGSVPLREVVTMLPWNRDASPWNTGSVLFITPDKKMWPYEPGTSLQDTFIDLIFAPPGKGKSVLLNTKNLALCLSTASAAMSGNPQLPRISIIDIGPSASGMISLLQEALPVERRHEVAYHRLRMSHHYAINPFDTQLGCRHPLPLEKSFLVNFLTALGTEVGETKPPSGLVGILGAAIDALYEKYDDKHRKGQPKRYSPNVDPAVDRAIAARNLEIKPGVTVWWDIVDALYKFGDIHPAMLAQRHAVPRLEDMMSVLQDQQVMEIHGNAKTMTGERVVDMCTRMISVSVRDYAILQRPTAFDIGDARVVALDLDEVAPKGGGPADKQTALMYMLARYVLARDYYMNPEIVSYIPEAYRSYHTPRIKRLKETRKRIVYDEFHRTSSAPAVRQQVLIDMREGRKWGVHIALASQLLKDFDEDMVDLATGIWILGAQDRAADEAAQMFHLSPTAREIIQHNLTGPGPKGAPFLVVLSLKEGKHEHFLYNTLGPTEIWALSTSAEDTAIRSRLYDLLGPVEGRRVLAERFKSGSAKKEIERRVSKAMERGAKNPTDLEQGIIEQLVKELAGDRYAA